MHSFLLWVMGYCFSGVLCNLFPRCSFWGRFRIRRTRTVAKSVVLVLLFRIIRHLQVFRMKWLDLSWHPFWRYLLHLFLAVLNRKRVILSVWIDFACKSLQFGGKQEAVEQHKAFVQPLLTIGGSESVVRFFNRLTRTTVVKTLLLFFLLILSSSGFPARTRKQ